MDLSEDFEEKQKREGKRKSREEEETWNQEGDRKQVVIRVSRIRQTAKFLELALDLWGLIHTFLDRRSTLRLHRTGQALRLDWIYTLRQEMGKSIPTLSFTTTTRPSLNLGLSDTEDAKERPRKRLILASDETAPTTLLSKREQREALTLLATRLDDLTFLLPLLPYELQASRHPSMLQTTWAFQAPYTMPLMDKDLVVGPAWVQRARDIIQQGHSLEFVGEFTVESLEDLATLLKRHPRVQTWHVDGPLACQLANSWLFGTTTGRDLRRNVGERLARLGKAQHPPVVNVTNQLAQVLQGLIDSFPPLLEDPASGKSASVASASGASASGTSASGGSAFAFPTPEQMMEIDEKKEQQDAEAQAVEAKETKRLAKVQETRGLLDSIMNTLRQVMESLQRSEVANEIDRDLTIDATIKRLLDAGFTHPVRVGSWLWTRALRTWATTLTSLSVARPTSFVHRDMSRPEWLPRQGVALDAPLRPKLHQLSDLASDMVLRGLASVAPQLTHLRELEIRFDGGDCTLATFDLICDAIERLPHLEHLFLPLGPDVTVPFVLTIEQEEALAQLQNELELWVPGEEEEEDEWNWFEATDEQLPPSLLDSAEFKQDLTTYRNQVTQLRETIDTRLAPLQRLEQLLLSGRHRWVRLQLPYLRFYDMDLDELEARREVGLSPDLALRCMQRHQETLEQVLYVGPLGVYGTQAVPLRCRRLVSLRARDLGTQLVWGDNVGQLRKRFPALQVLRLDKISDDVLLAVFRELPTLVSLEARVEILYAGVRERWGHMRFILASLAKTHPALRRLHLLWARGPWGREESAFESRHFYKLYDALCQNKALPLTHLYMDYEDYPRDPGTGFIDGNQSTQLLVNIGQAFGGTLRVLCPPMGFRLLPDFWASPEDKDKDEKAASLAAPTPRALFPALERLVLEHQMDLVPDEDDHRERLRLQHVYQSVVWMERFLVDCCNLHQPFELDLVDEEKLLNEHVSYAKLEAKMHARFPDLHIFTRRPLGIQDRRRIRPASILRVRAFWPLQSGYLEGKRRPTPHSPSIPIQWSTASLQQLAVLPYQPWEEYPNRQGADEPHRTGKGPRTADQQVLDEQIALRQRHATDTDAVMTVR